MALFLVGAALVALGILGGAFPVLEAPSSLAPRDVARMAVEEYNQATGIQAVFRLLKLRNTHKTKFEWGVHFSMNFTVKETLCRKTASYDIVDCKYKPNGLVRDCSAEMSVLNFMQDSPLTSVNCNPLQRTSNPGGRNTKPASRPREVQASPQIYVEHYFPSAFSTAALMAIEEE
uniref:Vipericidin n=1 Tax=Salvator merianae TaxID=96440 RepID=A0A8D0DU43_SALMN